MSMDTEFENIIPWNGASDTGRDVRLKWERNFAKVAVGFLELVAKDNELEEWINEIIEELKNFLRKDRPDETNFLVKFLGGIISDNIQSTNYSFGALGAGMILKVDPITGKSYIEVDELFVRMKAMFTELEIKKLSYTGGNYIFSAAGMKCAKIEEYDDYWRCFLLVDNGETAVENPFREGDQVRFQEFNIKPGVYEDVSNRYYWRLCVGIGNDYIDLSKADCDTNSDIPQEGDSLVQLGNRTDKKRQNAITLSVYGDDAPSIHQYAGIDSYTMEGKEVTVISPKGNKFMGDFILKTGVNILTQFQILEDLIHSEVSSIRDEIQAKDNYLYNSAFASNTNGWQTTNKISFFTVNDKFLYFNDNFYSNKKIVAVVTVGNRNVLRIVETGIRQLNADIAKKPEAVGGEVPNKFYISFRYKVLYAGMLTVGFPDQSLYFSEWLEPTDDFVLKEYSGNWDGTGDFELNFSGGIYIHSLALTDNAYEDMITRFQTQIEQTNDRISLLAKETTDAIESLESSISVTSKGIELVNTRVDKVDGSIRDMGISIDGISENLKLYVTKDGLGSEINVALDNITVQSRNIYFKGNISANGNVSIREDGTIKAINGYFLGTLETASSGKRIVISSSNSGIEMYASSGKKILNLGFYEDDQWGTDCAQIYMNRYDSSNNLQSDMVLQSDWMRMHDNRYNEGIDISPSGISFEHSNLGIDKDAVRIRDGNHLEIASGSNGILVGSEYGLTKTISMAGGGKWKFVHGILVSYP